MADSLLMAAIGAAPNWRVRVHRAANVALTVGAAVPFDVVDYDDSPNGWSNLGTGSALFVFPVDGYYRIECTEYATVAAAFYHQISSTAFSPRDSTYPNTAVQWIARSNTLVKAAANSSFQIISGSNLTMYGVGINGHCTVEFMGAF